MKHYYRGKKGVGCSAVCWWSRPEVRTLTAPSLCKTEACTLD
jgi:hypothetical protein